MYEKHALSFVTAAFQICPASGSLNMYILLKSKFQKIEEKPYIDNTLPDFIFDGVRRSVSRNRISCVRRKVLHCWIF